MFFFSIIKPLLPYTHVSCLDPEHVFHMSALADEPGEVAGASKSTPDFLATLKDVADHSSMSWEAILKMVIEQISHHLVSCETLGPEPESREKD